MSALVTKESLAALINTADEAKKIKIVGRALVALLERQTKDEQQSNDTHQHNTVGFSSADGKSGTLTAKSYLKSKTLLPWQLERWTRPASNGLPRICKYARQLNEIAEEKAKKVDQMSLLG